MDSTQISKKMTLPNGLECYYFGKEETEFIFSEVFVEQQYLRNGISIEPGDCIFDVGANIGLFSLFITQMQPEVQVYAFEPIVEIFQILQLNCQLHSLPQVALLNYGLSSENNPKKTFTFYPNMAGNSTLRASEKLKQREVMETVMDRQMVEYLFQSTQTESELKTLSTAIDELGIDSIDLLKIDVEGEEYEVLKGISEKDWSKIKQIAIEVHDIEGRLDKTQKLLTANGFNMTSERNNLLPPTLNNFNCYGVRN